MDTYIIENDILTNNLNETHADNLHTKTIEHESMVDKNIQTPEDTVHSIDLVFNDEKDFVNDDQMDLENDQNDENLLNLLQEKKHRHKRPQIYNKTIANQVEIPLQGKLSEEAFPGFYKEVGYKVNIPKVRVVLPKNIPRLVHNWEPANFHQDGESDDEFEMSTCTFPIYKDDDDNKIFYSKFKNGYPDFKGDVTSCFDEPNLLYRIINQDEKIWAFYNDTLKHEMHISVVFGKRSNIQPLGATTMQKNIKNEYKCELVVHPTETAMFVKGSVNGFRSSIRALPLTDDYHKAHQRITDNHIAKEIKQIREICESDKAEEVLQACLICKLPFVDPEFPPCQQSLDSGAEKPSQPFAWARPSMYLPEEMIDQVRLFRYPVKPGATYRSELGDSWVMCAVASVSEFPSRLMNMFRHPDGKEEALKERAIGAYRVMFIKNGWWRSIIVDDYLPISAGRPKFARSVLDDAEIWPCILQKAFAKLHGGYGAICSGDPLLAIQDMTGFPSTRLDTMLSGSISSAIKVFEIVKNALGDGSLVVFNTPGKNPILDSNSDLTKEYHQLGLITGNAYAVIDSRHFPEINVYLVKIRNAWGLEFTWNGEWSDESKKWEEYPHIAKACNFKGSNDGTFWMDLESVLKYFNGGGVCVSQSPCYDYRIDCTFYNRVPSTVLEIELKYPTRFLFMILLEDKRGKKGSTEYQPTMISIAAPLEEDTYEIILNSTADAYYPSQKKWSFTQARDVSLFYTLDAGKYIVIPRLMETENQPDEVPFILGMITNREVGTNDLMVNFKFMDFKNPVFSDFPEFEPDLQTSVVEVHYQKRPPSSEFPVAEIGFCIQ
ncbi:unnamed protein product [Phytomonas sp. Hart1]|nr:unnamed protein product [Phytomonas sp. Hart1]|eukprot:CCW66395.1 unnamed protein product [Phytomonas sp. isolate Hart1]